MVNAIILYALPWYVNIFVGFDVSLKRRVWRQALWMWQFLGLRLLMNTEQEILIIIYKTKSTCAYNTAIERN